MLEEELQEQNKLRNIDIANNLGDLYNILASEVSNLDNERPAKYSLLKYVNYLFTHEEIRDLIAVIFYAATSIAYKQKQSDNIFSPNWELPKIYYQESWRSRKLVNDILEYKPLTKRDIKAMIEQWSTDDPRYL